MGKIELTIGARYVTKNLRTNRQPTVFRRTIARLSKEGKNPGIIIPILTYIDGDYKIFGAVTLNSGGSISFFPDFHTLDHFDHLTLNSNFIEKKGHMTKVELNGKHKKSVHVEASALLGGYYHLATFTMIDTDLLMDAPEKIKYSEIYYQTEQQRQLYHAWIDQTATRGMCILEFPKEKGFYCIQILVLPKGKSTNGLAIHRDPIETALLHSESLEKEFFNTQITEIETQEKSDFSICILTFKVHRELKAPFCFYLARDPQKPTTTAGN